MTSDSAASGHLSATHRELTMSQSPVSSPVDEFPRPPALSFAAILWVAEEEVVPDPEDNGGDDDYGMNKSYTEEKEMFDVVGEQYRLDSTEAAAQAIEEEASFLPARFWLLCEDDNPHDANAVSVHAVAQGRTYHVGFLPRSDAELYRQSLSKIGRANETVEVVGCFTQGKDKPHPNCRLFLPMDFAAQLEAGIAESPENNPDWLRNPDPVEPRPFQGLNAAGFTDDELRKIFCRYAKRKRWFGLPHHCDAAPEGYRSSKLPEELEEFLLDFRSAIPPRTEPSREVTTPQSKPRDEGGSVSERRGSPRPRPTIVAEETIDLAGSVIERDDPKSEYMPIVGRASLQVTRRTSSSHDSEIEVKGIVQFEVMEYNKRSPLFVEVDLAGMPGIVEGICNAVRAVAARPLQEPKAKIAVRLHKKLSLVACTGERHAWTSGTNRVDFFLQSGTLEYSIVHHKEFMNSLAQAAGGGTALQSDVDDVVALLSQPA
jgi:hypothetical protein